MQTINDAVLEIISSVSNTTSINEANNFVRLLFNHLRGYLIIDLTLNGNEKLSFDEIIFLRNSIERLKQSEPIQYILGKCEFMGLPILVNKNVFIPRPETEELVEWALNEIGEKQLKILDIGTGSGVIACSIKKYAFNSTVEAWDFSESALETAKKNSDNNSLKIKFKLVDILNLQYYKKEMFDVIISNPPYVTEKEKIFMQSNVLNYEPHSALFVPDDNPLLFYKKISDFAFQSLKPNGFLFFEINESFGNEIINLLHEKGFKNIVLRMDISEKERLVKAQIP